MPDTKKIQEYGRSFLLLFLRENDEELKEATERLGGPEAILVLSSLLSVAVARNFGVPAKLDLLAKYARTVVAEVTDGPRQIVLEGVLRTGAGDRNILDGLPEGEVLEATALILRRVVRDLEAMSVPTTELIDRAVELAAAQPHT